MEPTTHERRIAAWRSPAPPVPQPILESVGRFLAPAKIALLIILGIPMVGLLLGLFTDLHLFVSLFSYFCLPASAIALLVAYTKHTTVGYQPPLQAQPGFRRGPSIWIEDHPPLIFFFVFLANPVSLITREVLQLKDLFPQLVGSSCVYTATWYVLRLLAGRSRKKALRVLASVFVQVSSATPTSEDRTRGFETSKRSKSFVSTEAEASVLLRDRALHPSPPVTTQTHGK